MTHRQLAEIERYRANFVALYRAATADQRSRGAVWYSDALDKCRTLAVTFDFELRQVVYAVAAISPLKSWERNINDARLITQAARHSWDIPRVSFGRQVQVALDCLGGSLHALSGPKVTNFAAAILGDTSAAVIDSHMIRASGWSKKAAPRSRGQYAVLHEALRRGAASVNLPVTTFQAIVWLVVREE